MDMIKEEQAKLNPKATSAKAKAAERAKKGKDLPDDSVSDITDLETEEVLAKYYKSKVTELDKRRTER